MTRLALPSVASLSDGELLARVAAGEYASLAPLYDRHQEAVARFVARAVGSSHDVEDIVQETFLCAARKAASFDGRLSCRPWLMGIAARQIMHVRRTFARLRGLLERHRRLDSTPSPDDPQQGAEKSQERRRLEQAIAQLSEAKRIVLLMAEGEEMTGEEISAALGIPVGTVWTRLHHARLDLRRTLGEGELSMVTCSRRWEAEAVRDGRLSGAEASSFQHHAASCAKCSGEVASLKRLGTSLRALPPSPRDALTVRRSRRLILQRLDQQQLRPERHHVFWMASAGGLLAVMALGLWLRPSPAPVGPPVVPGLSVEVVPRGLAVWSERQSDQRRELVLESGEILVKVAHKGRQDALVVRTPDAEIEDIGTIFSVQVEDGVTREVRVVEGAVNIRRRGAEPQVVVAGDRWALPAVAPSLPASAHSLSPALPLPSTSASAVARAEHGARSAPAASMSAAAAATARDDRASSEFEQAMGLFRSGQLAAAAARFESFARQHPTDPRAEDAAYLHVVALARGNQSDALRPAAASYLARYPGGLRAKEVQTLAR